MESLVTQRLGIGPLVPVLQTPQIMAMLVPPKLNPEGLLSIDFIVQVVIM